jgi:membrane glycosyltransferase
VVAVKAFTPFLNLTASSHAVLVFTLSMTVVLMPKFLSLLDLLLDRERREAFGGMLRASASGLLETLFSTFHAPIQMMFHTKFVISTLFGFGVSWGSQRRATDGISWKTALRSHWGHTALALAWGTVTWSLDPKVFWWFSPVLAGLALSIPISVLTSRESLGQILRRAGLLLTPEETATPHEITNLEGHVERRERSRKGTELRAHCGLWDAVLDPYINALHTSLLRDNVSHLQESKSRAGAEPAGRLRESAEVILTEGPESLSPAERIAVLSDPDTMAWLHHEAWCRPRTLI